MSTSNPLDRQELIELAALDVFGLLDEYDAALYNRSFHHAPVQVQREIIELQASLASDPGLLTGDEPAPGLRRRVLDAVSRAIEQESSSLAPLATIGPSSRLSGPDFGAWSVTNRSGVAWRAAALVMTAAVVIMSYFFVQANVENSNITKLALMGDSERLALLLGPTFRDRLFEASSRRVALTRTDDCPEDARATIEYGGDRIQPFLHVENLPARPGVGYQLVVVADDFEGTIDFPSNGLFASIRLDGLTSAALASASWTIRDAATGTVLLTSL
ncbi:MAG: hypothetical protein KDA25_03880 [Phycisphaerales bacterium]|nr:hypothetical protein [Phycisphaerales bacterium]